MKGFSRAACKPAAHAWGNRHAPSLEVANKTPGIQLLLSHTNLRVAGFVHFPGDQGYRAGVRDKGRIIRGCLPS